MKIVHRISFRKSGNPGTEYRLEALGIKLKPVYDDGKLEFEIAENHPNWPEVWTIVRSCEGAWDVPRTEFSKTDFEAADLFVIAPARISGYPLPDMDSGYRRMTYDLTGYCADCGMGLVQKAPFRIRGEPRWGKSPILCLNWVFDEFLVHPELWKTVFRKYGVECMPVLKHRTGEPLQTVVQLAINAFATSRLVLEHTQSDTCTTCHRTKYPQHRRGFFPPFAGVQSADVFKTQEYFGSGGAADHAIIASKRFYREIRDRRIKGICFGPLATSVDDVDSLNDPSLRGGLVGKEKEQKWSKRDGRIWH